MVSLTAAAAAAAAAGDDEEDEEDDHDGSSHDLQVTSLSCSHSVSLVCITQRKCLRFIHRRALV